MKKIRIDICHQTKGLIDVLLADSWLEVLKKYKNVVKIYEAEKGVHPMMMIVKGKVSVPSPQKLFKMVLEADRISVD